MSTSQFSVRDTVSFHNSTENGQHRTLYGIVTRAHWGRMGNLITILVDGKSTYVRYADTVSMVRRSIHPATEFAAAQWASALDRFSFDAKLPSEDQVLDL